MSTIKNLLCSFVIGTALPISTLAENIDGVDQKVSENIPATQKLAFREVNEEDVYTGVSVVDVESLIEKSYDTSSMPDIKSLIGGWTGNNMWGEGNYLLLVDGVPRDANDLTLSEVSQIVFMKGASSVVLYGSKAANGAVNIITKRGEYNKKLSITARATTGAFVAKSLPKYLGSAEYMSLYNEACANDGLSPIYSQEDIYYHASGVNPYRYSNLDYYSNDYLKDAFNRTNISLEIKGGTKRSRFYTNVGYLRKGNLFKSGNASNSYSDRLNVRGNLDMKISDAVKAYANANVVFENNKLPRFQNEDFWTEASKVRPNQFAPLIPVSMLDQNNPAISTLLSSGKVYDGFILGGNTINMTNSIADMYAAGYQKTTSRLFQFDAGIDFDLSKLTQGLSLHVLFGVDYNTQYRTSVKNSYAVYNPLWVQTKEGDKVVSLTKLGTDKETSTLDLSNSISNQTMEFAAHFDYNRVFAKKHAVSAMLLANGYQQTLSGEYHRVSNANLGIQAGYSYDHKYYVDFASSVVYSAKFAKGKRAAFSPSLTLGWNLKNEEFMKDKTNVDCLSLGLSGSILNQDIDIDGYFSYMHRYNNTNAAWSWGDGPNDKVATSVSGANENLSFVKRKELALNVKTSLFNHLINADFNVFYTSIEGKPVQARSTVPSYLYYPGLNNSSFGFLMNYNNDRIAGFDYNVQLNKKIGNVEATLGLVGTYYNTKAMRRDEMNRFSYQNMTGQSLNMIKGYESLGFFVSDEDIQNSPSQALGGTVRPGDLKYKDQNNDNIIDNNDMVYLESKNSPFHFGLNLTLRWKDFTLYAAGDGKIGGYGVMDNSYYWVFGERKYSEVVRGRWTPETASTATYPRLTTQSGNNNFVESSFWMYSTNQFNLRKIQLTYAFPERLFKQSCVKGFSMYAGASNILTISKEKKILETNVGTAPQNRYFDFGVKLTF